MPSSAAGVVSAESLTGKLRQVHDELGEGEREVYLEALGSPFISAERLCWSVAQMGVTVSISPSLVRTYRRQLRREARDL